MENETELDKKFMTLAIELAKKGVGKTNPNPLVGAVIVKDGKILGTGFHEKYGSLHAERNALKNCAENGNNPKGASIYVTLEPCCHYGKQPPCALALVESGIKKVFVGSRDPNPLVSGKGNKFLRENGIEVIEDFMKDECDALNEIFFYYIQHKMPFVCLKFAMTLDGKIATKSGKSKWISCQKSRDFVQSLRNRYSAILVGSQTVLLDDPMLTCRLENGSNPIRVICDSNLQIDLESKIVQSAKQVPTIVACVADTGADVNADLHVESTLSGFLSGAKREKAQALEKAGVQLLPISAKNGKVDLSVLMKKLGEQKIDSVLIEGGATINYSALESGIVNKIYAFVSPKIFGGNAKTAVAGLGVSEVDESFNFKLENITKIDGDVLLEYGAL